MKQRTEAITRVASAIEDSPATLSELACGLRISRERVIRSLDRLHRQGLALKHALIIQDGKPEAIWIGSKLRAEVGLPPIRPIFSNPSREPVTGRIPRS